MPPIKLAIAEDHDHFRKTLVNVLKQRNFNVIIEATNGLQLLDSLVSTIPDVVLLDIRMPLMNGMEAATRMLERNPRFKIIALTQYDLEENIVGMYIRGVSNFLSKTSWSLQFRLCTVADLI
jgi:DNA-binding NarL/FixJ family response regulator